MSEIPICTKDPLEYIGNGVTVERRYLDGVLHGIAYWHPDGKGGVCEGWIFFDEVKTSSGIVGWKLVSEHPLIVTPSVLCTTCKHHGWIRDGKWVCH